MAEFWLNAALMVLRPLFAGPDKLAGLISLSFVADKWLGLASLVLAAFCYNLATVLQAAEVRPASTGSVLDPRIFRVLVRKPRWLAGIGLSLAGWVLELRALADLPISVVLAGLVFGFAFLLIFAWVILKEKAGPKDLAAVVALTAGIALVFSAAPAAGSRPFQVLPWTACLAPLALIVAFPYILRAAGRRPGWFSLACSCGSAYAISALTTTLLARSLTDDKLVIGAAFVLTGAAIGVGFMSETSAVQQAALIKVVPVFSILDTIVPMLAAAVLFGEPLPHTARGIAAMAIGLAMVFASAVRLIASPAAVGALSTKLARNESNQTGTAETNLGSGL